MTHIFDLTRASLKAGLEKLGLKGFRADQIWQWVYQKGVVDPELMTNLGAADKAKLQEAVDLKLPEMTAEQKAADGVIKWLFKLHDGHEVETVFIPQGKRGTLCVSSQVGCTLTCRFCHTGTQALARNLTAGEIIAQVWLAKRQLEDFTDVDTARKLTNIVFMGMGEPLYNKENVFTACHILMDEKGFAMGGRKITISTSGVAPEIADIGEDLGVNLAVSLHSADNETRTQIMPLNKKYPLEDLQAALKTFRLRENRRITWEYVLLKGVNDSLEDAEKLLAFIKPFPSLVNLIPFNPWPGSPFECSDLATQKAFRNRIAKAGVDVTLRQTRGEDILAACGQLRSESSGRNTVSLQYPTVVAVYGNEKQKGLSQTGGKVKVEITDGDD